MVVFNVNNEYKKSAQEVLNPPLQLIEAGYVDLISYILDQHYEINS
jgi:hypothetical protein